MILTAGGQPFAVGREGNAIHVALMALQNANFLPRVGVPQPNPVVIPAGGEDLSVRGEGEAPRKWLAKAHRAESPDSPLRQRISVAVGAGRFLPSWLGRRFG